jgi:hypothetical protein
MGRRGLISKGGVASELVPPPTPNRCSDYPSPVHRTGGSDVKAKWGKGDVLPVAHNPDRLELWEDCLA